MKQSQKTLLSVLGVLGVLIFLTIAIIRGNSSAGQTTYEPIDLTEISQLKGFNQVDMSGAWNAQITQGDDWNIELGPQEIEKLNIKVYVNEQTLYLKQRSINFSGDNYNPTAKITIPSLIDLDIAGASEITIDGFNAEQLNIDIAGAAEITGTNSKFTDLNIDAAGAAEINFEGVVVTNADVDAAGAADLILHMNGGNLTGSMAGAGSIKYYGNIKNKDVSIFGAGSVEQQN